MKKVFLLSLGLLIGMAGFAQVKSSVKEAAKKSYLTHKSVFSGAEVLPATNFKPANVLPSVTSSRFTIDDVEFVDFETMVTNYDLQSNAIVSNRIAAWADGSVAVTETWDASGSTSFPDRGTGYNYYSGGEFGPMPESRAEPARSGWPTICAYGDGEILASHNTGVNVYYRATKGEGEWEFLTNLQTAERAWTWPRVACTENGTLHLIVCDQYANAQGNNISEIAYYQSTDGGHNWTMVTDPAIANLNADYLNQISADDYVLAVNGNTIALACFGITYDIFYVISNDGGQTWEKKIVAPFPLGQFDWAQTAVSAETDSIYWSDGTGSIAIGDDGTVHMAWALGRWAPAPESGWGYLSYWPVTAGIVYWNSNYVNPNGGNQIPAFGQWTGDNNPAWLSNGTNGRSSMMNDDRLMALAEEEGNINLHFFGFNSEAEPDNEDGLWATMTSEILDGRWGIYKSYGIASHPNIAIDNENNIYVVYTSWSDARTSTQNAAGAEFYLRSAFVHTCVEGVWQLPYQSWSLSGDFVHSDDEVYPTTCYPYEVDGSMWFAYSADDQQGCYLNDFDDANSNGQKDLSNNTWWVVKMAVIDDANETKDVVYNIFPNPASDYICISSEANVNATITFTNLAGQTVKSFNKALTVGENSINLNLESGVYFMTVNANGFNKTTKVVVK